MTTGGSRFEAVVFDLFFTLAHPSATYPGGTGRIGWLAKMIGVEPTALTARWAAFEPFLESGRAPNDADGLAPELAWVRSVAAEFGVSVTAQDLARINADWDLTRRTALLEPPESTVATLVALRESGLRLGILSNTHALELRAWGQSPIASLVDAVALSHQIGACKPDPASYSYVLNRLGVPAAAAAYVGDGGNDELLGARVAGFGTVVLAEMAPAKFAPNDLPRLRSQANASVTSLIDVVALVGR